MSSIGTLNIAASLAAVVFLLPATQAQGASQRGEEALIRQSVESLYIEGLKTRDFDLIRTICIPEALLMSVGNNEKLNVTSLDKWFRRFDPENPPFESLDPSILRIDFSGTAAQVKILFTVDGSRRVVDYLNMLRLEGTWRVVNIIDD